MKLFLRGLPETPEGGERLLVRDGLSVENRAERRVQQVLTAERPLSLTAAAS